jgi:hypothetical protein
MCAASSGNVNVKWEGQVKVGIFKAKCAGKNIASNGSLPHYVKMNDV